MKPRPHTNPRTLLPPEALRFLAAIRRHFGPDATTNVFVHHKPISPDCAQGEIGNPISATESEN